MRCLRLLALAAIGSTPASAADPLPPGAVAEFGSPRFQDFTIGGRPAFSPDGKKLATGGANMPVHVWDAATGELLRKHRGGGSVHDLRWRADRKLVALTFWGHDGFYMNEWVDGPDDGPPEALLREQRAAVEKAPERGYFGRAVFFPDGQRVLCLRNPYDAKRLAEVYPFVPNTPSPLVEPERSIPLGGGYGVWASHDGKFVFAHRSGTKGGQERLAAFDRTARDADRPAWELTFETANDHRISDVLSPDGRRVIVLFLNGDVELWDGPGGKVVRELPKTAIHHLTGGGELPGAELSPDGKRLALVARQKSGEMTGRIIDLESGKEIVALAPVPMPRVAGGPRFSPDGKRLALSGYRTLRVWDAESGADAAPFPGHRGRINSVAAAPDGKTVVTSGEDLTVRAWDPATGREKWKAVFPRAVAVTLATADAVAVESDWGAGVAEPLLDLATGKARKLPGAMGEGTKLPATGFGGVAYDSLVALAPDGKSAVTLQNYSTDLATRQSALRVWSWPAGELQKTLPLDVPKDLHALRTRGRFTPDGKGLVTVTECQLSNPLPRSGPIHTPVLVDRWDAATGKRLDRKQTADDQPVWTADGARLLVLDKERELRDAFGGEAVVRLQDAERSGFTGQAVLAPDGSTLAVASGWSGAGEVRLYDVKTGRTLATLAAGGRGPVEVVYLPDGRLVSAGETAIVWAADAADRVKPPEKP